MRDCSCIASERHIVYYSLLIDDHIYFMLVMAAVMADGLMDVAFHSW